jgi:radical SAM protein with 4Fe4S-binding SPASM domain
MNRLNTLSRMGHIFTDYRRRRTAVGSLPMRLWVESASACNLRCIMCPNKAMAAAEKGLMSFDLFRKIIDEAREFTSDLYLHHRGEPFLNPALFDMITYARKAGMKTRFHSNGTLMDEARARKLIAAEPDLVSFSVDGFEKQAYERVRVGATFEKTLENIFGLLRLRREAGVPKPYVVIEKIIFKNLDISTDPEQAAELARRFKDAGADEVIEKEEYIWAEESAPEPERRPGKTVCTFPWYAMVICWDGTVTPCPQDFHAKMKLGNVTTQSLREIWNGPAYQDLRRRLSSDVESLPLCRKCDRLRRKTVGGVPIQYISTFLTDHLVGYNRRLRRLIGTFERN